MNKEEFANSCMVSVVCIAYNHEKFIRDALEGILQQDVDFEYEVIVHDDASMDNTPFIIQEYEKRYPEMVRAIYESVNQFSQRGGPRVTAELFRLCKGKYIALCEGDDIWIDTHKLKIQINWMETHPDCFMTAHNALRVNYNDYSLQAMNPCGMEKEIGSEELIMQYNGNLPTASLVMRAEIKRMEDFFLECGVGDIPMQFYCMSKGRAYYFDRVMSVYRYNHEGSWCKTTLDADEEKVILHYSRMIRFAQKYDEYSEGKYHKYIGDLKLQYVCAVLNYCRNLSVLDFKYRIQMLEEQERNTLKEYINCIRGAFEQLHNEKYLSVNLRSFMSNHRHVYIWGTGNYGSLLARQFMHNHIPWEGFVVSDGIDIEAHACMEKSVYHISELNAKYTNLSIVVAVNVSLWKEIRNTLDSYGIREYSYMICV